MIHVCERLYVVLSVSKKELVSVQKEAVRWVFKPIDRSRGHAPAVDGDQPAGRLAGLSKIRAQYNPVKIETGKYDTVAYIYALHLLSSIIHETHRERDAS